MNVVIVRHAESKGNASGDYSVVASDSLSDKGQSQALVLAQNLRSYEFDKVVVSPLQRALETIAPYLEATDRHAQIWPEISEACWQEREEEPSESWRAQPASVPEKIAGFFEYKNDESVRPAESETFAEGLRRVHTTIQLIHEADAKPYESLLVITHGNFIRELLNLILDTRALVRFPCDNCGMTLLAFDGGWRLDFFNRRGYTIGSDTEDAGDGK